MSILTKKKEKETEEAGDLLPEEGDAGAEPEDYEARCSDVVVYCSQREQDMPALVQKQTPGAPPQYYNLVAFDVEGTSTRGEIGHTAYLTSVEYSAKRRPNTWRWPEE